MDAARRMPAGDSPHAKAEAAATEAGEATPAERLSRELREGNGPFLRNRRAVIALSMSAAAAMGIITLYQTGLIPHLPEPPIPRLDADRVDASGEAYEKLSTPDAAIGLASYATTLALAAAGGKDRARNRPWIPVALAGKAVIDALQAARLSLHQWTRHRAFCGYCLVAAGATFATLPLTIPEAREAVRQARRRIGA